MWFPGFHRVIAWRVERLNRKGDLGGAQRTAERYARWRPRDPHAWLMWAWTIGKGGEHEEAERLLRVGLDHCPSAPELMALLAHYLGTQGKYEECDAILHELQWQHPDSPLAYERLTYLNVVRPTMQRQRPSLKKRSGETPIRRHSSISPPPCCLSQANGPEQSSC
jgi:Flp pilus assembly protein TadD